MIHHTKRHQLHKLPGFVGASTGAAIARSKATAQSVITRYETLQRPGWTPPKRVFGTMGTVLSALMSVSVWLGSGVFKNRLALRNPARLAIGAWFAQLALNLAWSGFFLGARRIGATLYMIGGLWTAILAYMVWAARVSRFAAWLLRPYMAWVSLTSALNLTIWKMNRGAFSLLMRR